MRITGICTIPLRDATTLPLPTGSGPDIPLDEDAVRKYARRAGGRAAPGRTSGRRTPLGTQLRRATAMRRTCLAALALALALGAGGAGGPAGRAPDAPAPGAVVVRSELFFGRFRPDGTRVTDVEWHAFVADHVTPCFPDGLTVLDALGQYRGRSGPIVAEPTKILVILHPAAEGSHEAIEELRQIYRRLFPQESVLRVTSPVRTAF